MGMNKIGVVGAGTMGNGIAQVFASSGFEVVMRDVGQAQLDRGLASIQKSIGKFVEKGKLSQEDSELALERASPQPRDLGRDEGLRPCCRGNLREFRRESRCIPRLDGLLSPEAKTCFQHILNRHHPPSRCHQKS